MVATRHQGTQELLETIVCVAEDKIQVKGLRLNYGREMEEEIAKLEEIIATDSRFQGYSPRWLAVKLLEEDEEIIKKFTE